MNAQKVRKIVRMYRSGYLLKRIAKDTNTPIHRVYGVLLNRGVQAIALENRIHVL